MVLHHVGVPSLVDALVQVGDAARHCGALGAEELGVSVSPEVEEDASDGERQEVGAQQAAAVDGTLPLAAGALRRGARRHKI